MKADEGPERTLLRTKTFPCHPTKRASSEQTTGVTISKEGSRLSGLLFADITYDQIDLRMVTYKEHINVYPPIESIGIRRYRLSRRGVKLVPHPETA